MQFHSKAQEQALMRLQVQHEIAIAGIKNNEQLTEEEKQKALKEDKQFQSKQKRFTRLCFLIFHLASFFYYLFSFFSKKTIIFAPSQRGAARLRSYPLNLGR